MAGVKTNQALRHTITLAHEAEIKLKCIKDWMMILL